MAEKIYDIRPPQSTRAAENIKEIITDNANKGNKDVKKSVTGNQKRKPLKEIFIGGGIALILLAVFLYFRLPKSDVLIWPKLNQLSAEKEITADKSSETIDLLGGVIPAVYAEKELSGRKEFQSTGFFLNEKKAEGIIRIYNKLEPPSPLTLIKSTQFLSDSGKSFKTLEKVVIPAARYQKGKLTPGFVDVKVESIEPGEEYNIGTSKFSVPKLAGSAYFYGIYAESFDAMVGGYEGQSKKATKEDIEKAKSLLTNELLSEAENSLKKELSVDDILSEDVISRDIVSFSSAADPETITDKFEVSATVKISALIFKKKDAESYAVNYLSSRLSEGRNLLEESLSVSYNLKAIDIKGEKMTLSVKMSISEYQSIDTDYLTDSFREKSDEEMRDIVESLYKEEVSKVEVNLWPFWVRKAPKSKERINIAISFE